MKITAYAARPDEDAAFDRFAARFGMTLEKVAQRLTPENASAAAGSQGVTFLGNCQVDRETLAILKDLRIRYIASRSTGYNNVDLAAAKELGIAVSNAFYSPNSVAEFAILSMMNLLRRLPVSYKKSRVNDFTLRGIQGRELRNQVVGIVGSGKIGRTVAQGLRGFGCTVLSYDPYPSPEAEQLVEFVSLEELYRRSDVITLHVPLTEESRGMISAEAIASMKDEVVLVNSARGELVDTAALIEALRSGKVAGAALDVIEGEVGVLHNDWSLRPLAHPYLSILQGMPNVQITGHSAFYTRQSVSDMVEAGLGNLHAFLTTGKAPNELSL